MTRRSLSRHCRTLVPAALCAFSLAAPALAQEAHPPAPKGPSPEEVAKLEARTLSNIRQLTFDGLKAGEAYFSPDGKQVVFQSVREGCPHYQIYVMNADGSGQRLISTGKGKTTCSYFDPKVKGQFLYASTHLDESTWPPIAKSGRGYSWDFDASMDIFLAGLEDGSVRARLTEAEGYDAEASFSPDGELIVFTSTRDDPSGDLYIMKRDGSGLRRLTNSKGYDGGPFFSPDGKRVVFRGFRHPSGRIAQVFTIAVDGSDEQQLTWLPRINWCPIYHPNGEVIIYAANLGSRHNFELFLVKADGSGEVQITFDGQFDGLPCFSPDGKRLMWTSARDETRRSQIFVADFTMPEASAFKPQPRDVEPEESHGGYDYHKGEEGKEGKDPHGADPHSKDPHGKDPHGTNPHGSNPHGKDPHGTNPHGTDPHGAEPKGKDPHSSNPHAPAVGEEAKNLPIIRGSTSGGAGLAARPGMGLITEAELMADVAYLADDALEGREVGEPGGLKAASYLKERFAAAGAQPGALDGQWEHPFTFTAGRRLADDGQALVWHQGGRRVLTTGAQWQPLLYSASAATGRVGLAFCGYGITDARQGYDDFAGVDVRGRIAVILTRGPQAKAGGAFGGDRPTRFEDLRYKVGCARDAGAAGVLLLRSRGTGWLKLDGADAGLPVGQLEATLGRELLGAAGVNVDELIAAIDADLKPRSQVLDGCAAALGVKLIVETRRGQNILARIPGTDPELSGEIIVIGGHYDHLGYGAEGSLSGPGEIHNGADDNASGTAGLIALAKHFAKHPARRSILIMAFDGEERGLLGSAAWLRRPTVARERIAAMFNMDMIGRLATNKVLLVSGVGSCEASFQRLVAEGAHVAGLDVAVDPGGQGSSDHASFYNNEVPVLSFFTQTHEDYHRPSDDTDKVDGAGMERIVRYVGLLAREVADGARPTFKAVESAQGPGRKRVATGEALPYFGSIPDYAQSTELEGVLVGGARPGSPADTAGLQKGDVVVEFAGRTIRNIYDYTYAIQGCSANQEITVVVLRDGKRVTLDVTLGSR